MESRAKRVVSSDQADLLRQIPSVDELLALPRLAALAQRVNRELLVEITRTVLADLRGRITGEGAAAVIALDSSALEERITSMVEQVLASSLQPVINATGVILHTNLGRAPLSGAALEEIRRSVTSYSNLEYDLEAGARGKRDVHVAELLERLTGAEAAIVVNNCAAAVLLVLAALAKASAFRRSWRRAGRCCARWGQRTGRAWSIMKTRSTRIRSFCCVYTRPISRLPVLPKSLRCRNSCCWGSGRICRWSKTWDRDVWSIFRMLGLRNRRFGKVWMRASPS